MAKKKNFILIGIIILLVIAVLIGWGVKSNLSSNNKNQKTETTTEASDKDDTDEDSNIISTETDATETVKDDSGSTTTDGDDEEDNEVLTTRYSDVEDELFHVTLIFFDEYNYDSDYFTLHKAMAVQNESHDYLYFQYTYNDKTAYACYNYDGHYFRTDVSQSDLKDEYKTGLSSAKDVNKTQDEANIYYSYSKKEIKNVNAMY